MMQSSIYFLFTDDHLFFSLEVMLDGFRLRAPVKQDLGFSKETLQLDLNQHYWCKTSPRTKKPDLGLMKRSGLVHI